jgi:hypothetical protein
LTRFQSASAPVRGRRLLALQQQLYFPFFDLLYESSENVGKFGVPRYALRLSG